MRVLYLNHTSRISGGELSLITLLNALPAGVEATVACPEGPLSERLRSEKFPVRPIQGTDGSLRLHPLRTPVAVAEMSRAALQVRNIAKASGADLLHANSIRAGLLTSLSDRPTIVHVRDCLPSGRVSALALRIIGRSDALIATSSYTRSTLGNAAAGTRVVYNAVDLERFAEVRLTKAEARSRLGLGDADDPILAVVAQITPWKGQDDAIEIARNLLPAHPGLKLLLVGSPKFDSAATRYDNATFLASLRRAASELEPTDAVRFLGERGDIPEILRAVDLLLVPSWEEPFGRTVVEAMAGGVPVVATSVGGPSEILEDGKSGVVLPPRHPAAWAEAIAGLLDDEPRRQAMGEHGRGSAADRFGAERHAEAVLRIYETVAGGDGRHRAETTEPGGQVECRD